MTAHLHSTPSAPLVATRPDLSGPCTVCGQHAPVLFFNRRCLRCELDFSARLVGAEGVTRYFCMACEREYPVSVAEDVEGVWLVAGDDRCLCGRIGVEMLAAEPDGAAREEGEPDWDEDCRSEALTAGERNR